MPSQSESLALDKEGQAYLPRIGQHQTWSTAYVRLVHCPSGRACTRDEGRTP
jgi:hypothetical protein